MLSKTAEFVERFVDACGTSEPAEIQRLLNLPYQTVKNYLGGRLPKPDKLVLISERTSCSIDWLLTGRGNKYLDMSVLRDTPLPSGQMKAFVRSICVEVFNEFIDGPAMAGDKIVTIAQREIFSEKVDENSPNLHREPLFVDKGESK